MQACSAVAAREEPSHGGAPIEQLGGRREGPQALLAVSAIEDGRQGGSDEQHKCERHRRRLLSPLRERALACEPLSH